MSNRQTDDQTVTFTFHASASVSLKSAFNALVPGIVKGGSCFAIPAGAHKYRISQSLFTEANPQARLLLSRA